MADGSSVTSPTEDSSKKYDVFLSHDWQTDERNRNNHERVAVVNEKLKDRGYKTWFDSDKLRGSIRRGMAKGIDQSRCALIFLTKAYMSKVNSGDRTDKCRCECNYIFDQKEVDLLTICMDDTMCNPDNWIGETRMMLAEYLFVTLNEDLDNSDYLDDKIEEITDQLNEKGIYPSSGDMWERKEPRVERADSSASSVGEKVEHANSSASVQPKKDGRIVERANSSASVRPKKDARILERANSSASVQLMKDARIAEGAHSSATEGAIFQRSVSEGGSMIINHAESSATEGTRRPSFSPSTCSSKGRIIQRYRGDPHSVVIHSDNTVQFPYWSTIAAPNVVITQSDKAFFEVTFKARENEAERVGSFIGWATTNFKPSNAHENKLLGWCKDSWSYNGQQQKKWHDDKKESWGKQFKVKKGQVDQVIGVAADLCAGQLFFGLDGIWNKPMGAAFQIDTNTNIFPAISAMNVRLHVNFGEVDFRYGPPDSTFERLSEFIS